MSPTILSIQSVVQCVGFAGLVAAACILASAVDGLYERHRSRRMLREIDSD
jgi:hypothetical protein